jgi:hypothetical protein
VVTAVIVTVAAAPVRLARGDEPERKAGPTGGVSVGIGGAGPALQARAGWRVVPRLVVDAQAGIYAFTADLIGKSSDGSSRATYASTRFATAGASYWFLPSVYAGLHGGVVRLGELFTDPTGTAEVAALWVPAADLSAGWQFLRRPDYALGLEAQVWGCLSQRAGFLMDGALLLGAQIR